MIAAGKPRKLEKQGSTEKSKKSMNRQDWINRIGIAVLAAVIVVLWLAVPHPGKKVDGKTVINYWTGWTGHELEVLKSIVDKYNAESPNIYVKVVPIPSVNGQYQKTRVALAGHSTPDVCSTIWASELPEYAARGYVEPLDSYMKESGRSLDEYLTAVRQLLQYDGKTYALSITVNTKFIVYNRQILKEVGWDPDEFPKTTSEMDKLADACVIRDANGGYKRYGYRPGDLLDWARMFGGNWYDEKTGKVTADDPRNVAALAWMAGRATPEELRKMSAMESSYGSMFSGNSPYYTGRIAFRISGEWEKQFVDKYKPGFDWGFAPFPQPPGGRKFAGPVDGSVFVIPKASKHKKEAWDFLSWLTRPENAAAFSEGVGNTPPLKACADMDYVKNSPILSFAVRLADSPESFSKASPIPVWQMYHSAILRAEEQALLGGRDPEDALEEVQNKIQTALDQYRERTK